MSVSATINERLEKDFARKVQNKVFERLKSVIEHGYGRLEITVVDAEVHIKGGVHDRVRR